MLGVRGIAWQRPCALPGRCHWHALLRSLGRRDAVCIVPVGRRLLAGGPGRCGRHAFAAGRAQHDCLHGYVVHGYAYCLARAQGARLGYAAARALRGLGHIQRIRASSRQAEF